MATVKKSILPETDEEIIAVEKLLSKMRAERHLEEVIQQHTERLKNVVMSTIDVIGLEETKRIIRNINRSLREEREKK